MNAEDKTAPTPADRRHERRQRVLKGALVVFGNYGRAFDCVVRNLSPEGAKLTLESTSGVPDRFDLLIPVEQRIAPVVAVWRNNKEIGVTFAGPWRRHEGRG